MAQALSHYNSRCCWIDSCCNPASGADSLVSELSQWFATQDAVMLTSFALVAASAVSNTELSCVILVWEVAFQQFEVIFLFLSGKLLFSNFQIAFQQFEVIFLVRF